jgi:FdhD protein
LTRSIPSTPLMWPWAASAAQPLDLIAEEPLAIRVQGRPYVVVMRTPGDEKAHAAGLCLAEGLVDAPEDITALAYCDGEDTHTVTVTLAPERLAVYQRFADRRTYISQTSCGICGRELVEELHQALPRLAAAPALDPERVRDCIDELAQHQPLRSATRAAHAAAVYDRTYGLLGVAEDVGRHNALDKCVGRLFLDGQLGSAALVVLSSRISYELVQKAARAQVPVVAAVSRPTGLAVALAERLNMALVTAAGPGRLFIHCGSWRLGAGS